MPAQLRPAEGLGLRLGLARADGKDRRVLDAPALARLDGDALRDLIFDDLRAFDPAPLLVSGEVTHASTLGSAARDVAFVPGERTIELEYSAQISAWGTCGAFAGLCNANGTVRIRVALRPEMRGQLRLGLRLVGGDAWLDACQGDGCADLDAVVANLFDRPDARATLAAPFQSKLSPMHRELNIVRSACESLDHIESIEFHRVNVTPDFLEVVVAETAGQLDCAQRHTRGIPFLSLDRPARRSVNSDGSAGPRLVSPSIIVAAPGGQVFGF